MHLPVPRDSRVLASPPPAPDFVHPLHLTSAHLKLVYLTFVHLKSGYLTFVHRDLSVTFVQLESLSGIDTGVSPDWTNVPVYRPTGRIFGSGGDISRPHPSLIRKR